MTTISNFFRCEDAYLFRSFLDSAGINGYVLDENFSQWFWYYSHTVGGIRVVVADEDAKQAEQLFIEYNESMKTTPFVERPVRAWPIMVLLSLCAGFPLILFGRKSNSESQHDADPEI
jgi:hypothetical protein